MCNGTFKKHLSSKFSNVQNYAEGGNSFVYQAEQEGEAIAIKVYNRLSNDKQYQRFLQELKTIKRLNGTDGIVPVLQMNDSPPTKVTPCSNITDLSDMAYYVMAKYPKNLSQTFGEKATDDDGSSGVKSILSISRTIKRLHDKSLAHRDLKPENILLDKDDNLLVADFGLSIDLDNTESRLSEPGELIGAVNYRAPEFLRGRLDDADHRPGDIFSLGRMLWSVIFDKEAYNLTDWEFERTLSKIASPIRKPQLLQNIIKAATNNDPQYRLTIDELIAALEGWLKENTPRSTEAIIDILTNSDNEIKRIMANKLKDEIEAVHKDTMFFLKTAFQEMVVEWSKIVLKGEEGSIVSHHLTGYAPSESFGLWTYLNQPGVGVLRAGVQIDTTKYITIDLALYISYNNQDYEKSLYAIVPAYFLPFENPVNKEVKLAGELIKRKFDYRSANVKFEMLRELKAAFERLDKIFRDQF